MIQVQKSASPPAVLTGAGVVACQALEKLYAADPPACHVPGNRVLNVAATIYNEDLVKDQLVADQHGKCCYCESKLLATTYGDVEHFRPKNGYKQAKTDKRLSKPGYYWLAYRWENLFLACERCNRSFKRNYFPLADPAGRATSHQGIVGQEQPLLLDPAADDPTPHIGFLRHVAKAKTLRGKTTISGCGLNRAQLLERRRTILAQLESHEETAALDIHTMTPAALKQAIRRCGSQIALIRRILQAQAICAEAALDSAEYAGMVRANFPHLPQR